MQQALLGRGSNRKTAAGGLKEAVLERCACAPQNLEESGGDRNEGTVSRKGTERGADVSRSPGVNWLEVHRMAKWKAQLSRPVVSSSHDHPRWHHGYS